MAQRPVVTTRKIYISSSIKNFQEKLLKRIGFEEYQGWKDIYHPTIFFGLYHWRDWFRFIRHRGPKKVFWCGSDILALAKNRFWRVLIFMQYDIQHYCENQIEKTVLRNIGIEKIQIRPMIFDDPEKFPVSYKHSNDPKFFMTYHKGREKEYHIINSPEVDCLEGLSEQEFNEKIKHYQGAIRLNVFDGFAETLAKSILMGQYPLSIIEYPYMLKCDGTDIYYLLKTKTKPNIEGREYWLKVFEESRKELCEHW